TRTRTMAPSKSSGLGLAPPQSRVDPAAAAQCRDPAPPLMPLPGECVQCQRVLAVGLRQLFDLLSCRPSRTALWHRRRAQVTGATVVALVGGRALGEGDGATDQFAYHLRPVTDQVVLGGLSHVEGPVVDPLPVRLQQRQEGRGDV